MGFLDNSGDIILDAVLTDTGRFRLAKGDGTFRIAKFALGDDEINYSLYNQNHSSGSAYYDLEILQSPVLEAFTNNTSLMKSKLISIPRTNLLYLPIIKVYEEGGTAYYSGGSLSDLYIVTVDEATEGGTGNASTTEFRKTSTDLRGAFEPASGILGGFRPNSRPNFIEVHQGLDTTEIPPSFTIDSDLRETQYIIEMDNRLGTIVDHVGTPAPVSFVDDDNVASYFISQAVPGFIDVAGPIGTEGPDPAVSPIAGPRGTKLRFKIKSSVELATSTFLFTKLGSTMTDAGSGPTRNFRFIDSTIRITGATTGYRIDIPVRFVKSTT